MGQAQAAGAAALEETRIRLRGSWFQVNVEHCTAVDLTVAVAAPIADEGVCHLAMWIGGAARPVHVQGDIIEVARERGRSIARLRYRKLFSKVGRKPLDDFARQVMGRDATESGAYSDSGGGSYYDFALEVHAPTMAMIWRPTG